MDGSMIGANLGVNPSLTITALAEHVCGRIPPKAGDSSSSATRAEHEHEHAAIPT
jgi:cholesterol oxidase